MTGLNNTNTVVIGAGTMGHGIAHVCALAGLPTTLVDVDQAVLDKGRAAIETNLQKGVDRGKISAEDMAGALSRLSVRTDAGAYAHAGLIIEAVPERMELKQSIFRTLDEQAPADCVLGTNTSSLSITAIAAATKRPDRVVGLHFFNPVHIMKLLEVVRGVHTSEATLATARGLAETLGKTAIFVDDAPGFATSRLGITLGNEAMRMVEQGVAGPRDIDTAMTLGYKHPMGPLMLTDLVGLDVRYHISQALYEELGTDTFRPPLILRKLVRAGALGKKTGAGFYLYENGQVVGENPLVRR